MRHTLVLAAAVCLVLFAAHTLVLAADAADPKPADPSKAVEKKAEADPRDEAVVTSTGGKVYHREDCRWAKRIKPENLKKFKSGHEAELEGLRPCKVCFKELYKEEGEKGEKGEEGQKGEN